MLSKLHQNASCTTREHKTLDHVSTSVGDALQSHTSSPPGTVWPSLFCHLSIRMPSLGMALSLLSLACRPSTAWIGISTHQGRFTWKYVLNKGKCLKVREGVSLSKGRCPYIQKYSTKEWQQLHDAKCNINNNREMNRTERTSPPLLPWAQGYMLRDEQYRENLSSTITLSTRLHAEPSSTLPVHPWLCS